jgi:hypothetical protein
MGVVSEPIVVDSIAYVSAPLSKVYGGRNGETSGNSIRMSA